MSTTVQVNDRGSLTLPKAIRKALGLEKGGVVLADLTNDGIVLRPAVAFPIELYTDERIAEFDESDRELGQVLDRKQNR
jgi:AbrB family looped-hinge helix DNA binding protein